jgi:transmembrane sensor
MEKSNFDTLMERYLAGKVTPYERLKIEAWLEVMKTERTTDLELTRADEERLFKKITGTDTSVGDIIAMHPQRSRMKRIFSKQWVQIAASVTILLAASFTIWNLVSDSAPLLASSGKEKVILNDGTIVWMEQGSNLVYYEKDDGTRRARLTGEALFEVAKIPNSSFTVECGKITVGVVGTSFTLEDS